VWLAKAEAKGGKTVVSWSSVPVARAVPEQVRRQAGAFNASEDIGRDRRGTWHAQAGQDRTAAKLLRMRRGGFFLDLAANEPVILSNSRTLERDLGYTGICIEANPFYWGALARVRSGCAVVGAAISSDLGTVKFRAFKARGQSRNSGIVGGELDNKALGKGAGHDAWYEFEAQTVSLGDVLRGLKAPPQLDYFSLDIEGAELLAMRTFPWADFRFSVLTVERPKPELQNLLEQNGYTYLCDHGMFGDQTWVDSKELSKGPLKSSISLEGVQVEEGPTVHRTKNQMSDKATDPKGKRCDLNLHTGLYGTHPKHRSRDRKRSELGSTRARGGPQRD